MKLTEMLGQYEELLDKKDTLDKETVNPRSLQSAMKEIADENDGELPPELDEVVSSYEMTDIARRKSTNKALKKAKKGE